jgi:hypothetical protein
MSFRNILKINSVRIVTLSLPRQHSLVPVVARYGAAGNGIDVSEKTPANA